MPGTCEQPRAVAVAGEPLSTAAPGRAVQYIFPLSTIILPPSPSSKGSLWSTSSHRQLDHHSIASTWPAKAALRRALGLARRHSPSLQLQRQKRRARNPFRCRLSSGATLSGAVSVFAPGT